MKATTLYALLGERFTRLKAVDIDKGKAFFLDEVRRGHLSTRIIRVHERADGTISEIKLAVTALDRPGEGILRGPVRVDEVCAVVDREIEALERKLVEWSRNCLPASA
jgi:hypothetical protein